MNDGDTLRRIEQQVNHLYREHFEGTDGRPSTRERFIRIEGRLDKIERNGHGRAKLENAPTVSVAARPPSSASGMPTGARNTALVLGLVGVITVLANAIAKLVGV